ncbi:MAG: sulfotransferase [Rhodobacteraceae bacterium]|nr:sulfotransferase [Paracoccaceae bacterium]
MIPGTSDTSGKFRMLTRYHFIAGLPRAGLVLLSALLGQNPRFVAGTDSPAADLFTDLLQRYSDGGACAGLLEEDQGLALLRAALDSVYQARPPGAVVFDTNPDWLAHVDTLVRLYPLSRFIICVRNPASIVNSFALSDGIGSDGPALAGYADKLVDEDGVIGRQLMALRDALSSRHAERMLVLDYDRLADDPDEVLDVIYDFLREPAFAHDVNNVELDGEAGPIKRSGNLNILPTRMILQLSGRAFWRNLKRTQATMLLGRSR